MSLREAVRIALNGLRVNRLRLALTMLGIIIGVTAVILLVAIGNGVQTSVNEKVQPLAYLMIIVPTTSNIPGGQVPRDLIAADATALQKQMPNAAVIPDITSTALTETDTKKVRARVVGSTEDWLRLKNGIFEWLFYDEGQARSNVRVASLY